MVSIIKTAIITIIISFISGLLLEYYKNLAPRILCKIGNGVPLVMNNKKICAYILTVRNISNKTIHEISLNIQGLQNNLKSGDAKITKGLKFDSSAKDNILDVSIPFLSKDDEFSVTLYVENQYGVYNKPVVTIRSPENFKEVDSVEQNGILALLFDIPKNISKVFSNTMKENGTSVSDKKGNFINSMNRASGAKKTRSNKLDKNKKAIIAILSLILVISIGGVGGLYYKEISANEQTPDTKADVQKQSTNATESAGATNKNTSEKGSISGTAKNTSEKGSISETNKNAGTKTSTSATNENADSKASTQGTNRSTDTKSSTDETNESKDAKTSASAATKNTDTKSSTDGTIGNTDTKTSTEGTTKNTDTKSSTSGTTGNADTKASTGGTTGSTSN